MSAEEQPLIQIQAGEQPQTPVNAGQPTAEVAPPQDSPLPQPAEGPSIPAPIVEGPLQGDTPTTSGLVIPAVFKMAGKAIGSANQILLAKSETGGTLDSLRRQRAAELLRQRGVTGSRFRSPQPPNQAS
jgi:hypothetical protein